MKTNEADCCLLRMGHVKQARTGKTPLRLSRAPARPRFQSRSNCDGFHHQNTRQTRVHGYTPSMTLQLRISLASFSSSVERCSYFISSRKGEVGLFSCASGILDFRIPCQHLMWTTTVAVAHTVYVYRESSTTRSHWLGARRLILSVRAAISSDGSDPLCGTEWGHVGHPSPDSTHSITSRPGFPDSVV